MYCKVPWADQVTLEGTPFNIFYLIKTLRARSGSCLGSGRSLRSVNGVAKC